MKKRAYRMSLEVSIRSLESIDQDNWKQVWTEYLNFYETTVSTSVYKTAFKCLISHDLKEYQCFVAELNGEIIGLAHYLFHRNLWSVNDTCYLSDLFVVPKFRGKGIARKLIQKVAGHAKDHGVEGVYWMTQEFNYKGRILYDQVAEKTPFIVYEMS